MAMIESGCQTANSDAVPALPSLPRDQNALVRGRTAMLRRRMGLATEYTANNATHQLSTLEVRLEADRHA
eukprot:40710-Eustigmatos_ZCMA.PRE.1